MVSGAWVGAPAAAGMFASGTAPGMAAAEGMALASGMAVPEGIAAVAAAGWLAVVGTGATGALFHSR